MQETWVRSLGWEDPLEKGRATHFIFWPGEFHGLYSSWGSQRVGHDLETFAFQDFPVKNLPAVQETRVQSWVRKILCRREWQSTQVFWPGESHGQRSLEGYSPWGSQGVQHDWNDLAQPCLWRQSEVRESQKMNERHNKGVSMVQYRKKILDDMSNS